MGARLGAGIGAGTEIQVLMLSYALCLMIY